jgi:hypothetical protein
VTEESRVSRTPSEEVSAPTDTNEDGSGRERRSQPVVMTCSGCTSQWTGAGRAHCAAEGCHRTFTGVTAFEQHRGAISEGAPRGFCHDPVSLGMVERKPNLWGAPAMTPEQIDKVWGDKQ